MAVAESQHPENLCHSHNLFPLQWVSTLVCSFLNTSGRFCVLQPRHFVPRRGDDAPAVGAERRAIHSRRVARERLADLLAALGVPHVPQPRRCVQRPGDDALTVGAERRARRILKEKIRSPRAT
jgi:hypothetical protein